MLVTPDLSEAQDKVSPGEYSVRIKDVTEGSFEKKDGSGSFKFLNWKLETFGESEAKNNGRSIFMRTPVSGRGVFRLQDLYKAATKENLSRENPSFNTEQLLGRELKVTVVDQTDADGRPTGYTDVKTCRPL